MSAPAFAFDNSYARDLPGFWAAVQPAPAPEPRLLHLNRELAEELGLDPAALSGPAGAALFAGNALPAGAQPIAQVYAGHQFGGFSPQLGDGRALLLGELIDREGRRRDIAFKGSGPTPFSRRGDGKAAVGPMLRELLIGEAMHALGIPTTRALAVAATGEPVSRESVLPGAVLTRVAASHLRVGTFQYFAARGEHDRVRQLADYAIARHDPALAGDPDRHALLLHAVAQRQAALVARWMEVGFIHGVMNTDNMTLSGETIDYGPCAFLEAYQPEAVFSSIDHQGRYAYRNQPVIARWNLARFAETLLPLIDDDADAAVARAMTVLDAFPDWLEAHLRVARLMRLGLPAPATAADPADLALLDDWLGLLQSQRVDHTLGWRRLADAAEGQAAPLQALFAEPASLAPWLARWRARCAVVDGGQTSPAAAAARAAAMRRHSPWIIARNHRVEEALAAASDHDDLGPLQALLQALREPFEERPGREHLAEPAPSEVTAAYRTFCGT